METRQKLHIGKPSWLKTPIPKGKVLFEVKKDLRDRKLFTVCEEAKCPNISECWSQRTATFMVGGDVCTRACRFCNVKTGNPQGWLDTEEPSQVAASCAAMKLEYVVITMVDRDDLSDGGSAHVSHVVEEVRKQNPEIKIEFLAGDFSGQEQPVRLLIDAGLQVFAHNIETVERLTPRVRDQRASYRQSLSVLRAAADYCRTRQGKDPVFVKSSIMLGLGETKEEVQQTLQDLIDHGVDFVTLGQYMRPSKRHLSIKRWVTPQEFDELGAIAKDIGFKGVASGPLVRSSYKAHEFYLNSIN